MNVYKELIDKFLGEHSNPTRKDLYNFIINNEWRFCDTYMRNCHRQDIIDELIEREYETDKIPDDLIANIVYYFEEKLGDYGAESGWRIVLDWTLDEYEEDLAIYKKGTNL